MVPQLCEKIRIMVWKEVMFDWPSNISQDHASRPVESTNGIYIFKSGNEDCPRPIQKRAKTTNSRCLIFIDETRAPVNSWQNCTHPVQRYDQRSWPNNEGYRPADQVSRMGFSEWVSLVTNHKPEGVNSLPAHSPHATARSAVFIAPVPWGYSRPPVFLFFTDWK